MPDLVGKDGERVSYDDEICKVSVVGVGMRSHAGVAKTMFQLLAAENINIQLISTSEIKISCVIARKYAELAVRALHDGFGLSLPPSGARRACRRAPAVEWANDGRLHELQGQGGLRRPQGPDDGHGRAGARGPVPDADLGRGRRRAARPGIAAGRARRRSPTSSRSELNAATFVRQGGDDEPCDYIYVLCMGRTPCVVQVRDHGVAIPAEWRDARTRSTSCTCASSSASARGSRPCSRSRSSWSALRRRLPRARAAARRRLRRAAPAAHAEARRDPARLRADSTSTSARSRTRRPAFAPGRWPRAVRRASRRSRTTCSIRSRRR